MKQRDAIAMLVSRLPQRPFSLSRNTRVSFVDGDLSRPRMSTTDWAIAVHGDDLPKGVTLFTAESLSQCVMAVVESDIPRKIGNTEAIMPSYVRVCASGELFIHYD